MKHDVSKFKTKKSDGKEKGPHINRLIGPDLPFDYDAVVSVTGPEYIRNLHRDVTAVLPYEKLRRNVAGFLLKAVEKPKYTIVSGLQIADNYYHHTGHSWVNLAHDGWVRIGIDSFASKVFGPADTIDLPQVGDFLMQGETGWTLIRNSHKAPIQSPVSGIVVAVNDRIKEKPDAIHYDPYEEGWLFFLNPVSLEINIKQLYWGKECFQWIEKETENLIKFLGPRYERLAATGGTLIDDIFGHFPDISWDRLVKTFLFKGEKI